MAITDTPTRIPRPPAWRRFLPLALLAAGLAAFFALGLQDALSLSSLARHREALLAFVAANEALAVAGYIVAYALAVAFSVPGATVLTLTGGFLFGTAFGTVWAVIGATSGAVAVFLAARTALGDGWRQRAAPWLQRFEEGFRRDAFNYMLVLRLVPLFPFWLVNLVPALLGVPLRAYTLATLIGIIPGGFVYASVGNGLGTVLAAGRTPDLSMIATPEVLLPLLGLAALALVPVVWRRFRKE
ncbi:MAG TPA: TVP38/TMEM64 family protein [Azospirillaceae bacterium]|nr:TVP38/TMEM64 family protein [Azospirillaceae bacterium]